MTKRNRNKVNDSKPEAPEMSATQVVEAVIVPIPIFNEMRQAVRKLSIEEGEVLWATVSRMKAQPITMQMPPPQE